MLSSAVASIYADELWPLDAAHRYRLYAYRDGGDLRVLGAAGSMSAVGLMIQTLHEDAKQAGRALSDEGIIGIRDVIDEDWIVKPFPRSR